MNRRRTANGLLLAAVLLATAMTTAAGLAALVGTTAVDWAIDPPLITGPLLPFVFFP
jgi:cell shape-determining protein MreD